MVGFPPTFDTPHQHQPQPPSRRANQWRAAGLWRVQLQATPHTTPALTEPAIQPGVRRLVVSDLHLGAGDQLEEFAADDELAAFVQDYAGSGEPTELILNGDTFEFLQSLPPGIDDYEWSPVAAERRLALILAAHQRPVAALRAFVKRPGCQLTVMIGNHDFELHYAAAKHTLRAALGLAEDDERLRFATRYEGCGIYLVHGNQFDPWNRFVYFDGIAEPFEVLRGTRVVKDVINRLKVEPLPIAPLLDNVKPISALVWHLLSLPRLRDPAVRRFVVRGLLMIARSTARVRRYLPPPAPDAQPPAGISLRLLRRRGLRRLAQIRSAARRLVRGGVAGDDAVTQLEREAGQKLKSEIRAFRGDTLRAVARIARMPAYRNSTLFVCGHTHLAQAMPLSSNQSYVNTGTWTDVVLDVTRGRQEQRFPFLEITYDSAGTPHGRLLVWHGAGTMPQPWANREGEGGA
jgi:UDP-2,3-diacylglucosamine pyrophosphatase LpxH